MENFEKQSWSSGSSRRGGVTTQLIFGIVILAVGAGLLLRKMGVPLPYWLFRWEMILILVGIVGGVRNQFRDFGWLIPIIIGCIFLSDDIFPNVNFRGYIWPIGLIALGAVIIFGGRNRKYSTAVIDDYNTSKGSTTGSITTGGTSINDSRDTTTDTGDVLDVTAVFGGAKRAIVSKNFLGGEVVSVLGGAEINLANADIQGPVRLESVNVLGGTKLIVPSDWDVQSEVVAIFGGVDDKRNINPAMINPKKKLILIGTSFLGGLEIKSY